MNQNVSTLKDRALDWAFAAALGLDIYHQEDLEALGKKESKKLGQDEPVIIIEGDLITGNLMYVHGASRINWWPSRNWSQAMSKIWTTRGVSISYLSPEQYNKRSSTVVGDGHYEAHIGKTSVRANNPLQAICRAVIVDKFGVNLGVPDELI